MTPPLTLTAYAKRRGCSVKSVSLAIKVGRLVGCVGRDEHKRPTILDAELADREWSANTRHNSGQGTPAWKSGDENSSKLVVSAGSNPAPDTTPPAGSGMRELPGGVPDYNTSRAVRAAAAARRESHLADMAELELASKRGRLVDADEATADFVNHISNAKTRLLAIPSAVGQRFPEFAASVVPVVEDLLRAALEELAVDGRRG